MLVRENYLSAGVGKLFHHPRNGSSEFPNGRWDGGWYKYQNSEDVSIFQSLLSSVVVLKPDFISVLSSYQMYMNSSVTPDSNLPDHVFRDHQIADKAIEKLRELATLSASTSRPFLLSVGFKQPHTQYHMPRRFYDLYQDNNDFLSSVLRGVPTSSTGDSSEASNVFPVNAPIMNYRCCAKESFRPMERGGTVPSRLPRVKLRGMMFSPTAVRHELLSGYFAGISFLDYEVAL